MQSIGIFSGTFNPVHDGHIAFAREALRVCALDKVVFLPEKSPRDKTGLPDVAIRADQLRQAIAPWPELDVLVLDQAQFTIENTMPELRRQLGDVHFTLLIGSDVARGLADWPDIAHLAAEVSFAIGIRQEDTSDSFIEMWQRIESLTGIPIKMTYIQTDFSHISSRQFRQSQPRHSP